MDASVQQGEQTIAASIDQLNNEVAEKKQETARARDDVRVTMLAAVTAAVLLGAGLAALVGLSTAQPIGRLCLAMQRLAAGATTEDVPDRSRRDELGEMARAVQVFKESTLKAEELARSQLQIRAEAEAAQKAALHRTAAGFEERVGRVIATLSESAGALRDMAEVMSANAGDTSQQSATVAAAAEQASTSVATLAAAAEELTASIHEISRQVAHASGISGKAVSDTERTNAPVQRLSRARTRSGKLSD